jgi:hypothetical protein
LVVVVAEEILVMREIRLAEKVGPVRREERRNDGAQQKKKKEIAD